MFWYILIGFLLGVGVAVAFMLRCVTGTLTVFMSDNGHPYVGLKVDKSADFICGRKYVSFRVDVKRIESQK